MAELIFTGRDWGSSYKSTPFATGFTWLEELKIIGLDTETNVVDSILARKLKVISISDEKGSRVWVIEWEYLSPEEQALLLMAIRTKLSIIQNVTFDYSVFKINGVVLNNVYDTMLAEQVLTSGLSAESGYHGLQAIIHRRFGVLISKDEQTTFDQVEPYTDDQIKYAAIDTLKLGTIRTMQLSEMNSEDARINQRGNKGLRKTSWWENEYSLASADMEMAGVRIHSEKWDSIEDSVMPTYLQELDNLNAILKEDFYDLLLDNNWVYKEDSIVTNVWSSAKKKAAILGEIFNFPIEKTSKVELKKLLQEHDPDFPEGQKLTGKAWENSEYPTLYNSKFAVLKLLIIGSNEKALDYMLMTNYRDLGVELGWIVPAGKILLNWNSPVQRLKVFQAISTEIESTGKEILEDYIEHHKLIPHYLSYAEVAYQIKSFGKDFYTKHVEIDGKFRTRFRQILATGRISSTSPNLLAIPHAKVYRNCFIPDPGFEDIGADYDGGQKNIMNDDYVRVNCYIC